MRKKIYRLSQDQFDTRKVNIISSIDEIDTIVTAGVDFKDAFFINGEDDEPVRGVIYSTNPYIVPIDYQFDGVNSKIEYTIKHNNFKPGDVLNGEFIIVGCADTISIPVSITFTRKPVTSSQGVINDLTDFARLCQENFIEAGHIFHTDSFIHIIDESDDQLRLLYTGYRRAVPSASNLEEFLVAAGLKERITISLDKTSVDYSDISMNRKEEILITKSSWGNVEIDVSVDADFVTIEKEHIDSDYFLGSQLHYDYYIHKNRMHPGVNLARISFDTNNQHLTYIIRASLEGEGSDVDFAYHDLKRRQIKFVQCYLDYRLLHITTSEWADESIRLIDTFITDIKYALSEGRKLRLDSCGSDIEFYELMKAHVYIADKRRQEALWIISRIKREIRDKKSVKWAYLLYLCTLIEREPGYVDKLTGEIEVIFRSHPDDVRIFWYLLFLREEYSRNTARKLKDILQWMENGYNTPYLYVEAFAIYRKEPHLIKELSKSVVRILSWAASKDALTKDICSQYMALLSKEDEYDSVLYEIASSAYEVDSSDENLEIMVGYLIRTRSYGSKFLKWYELSVYKEMRIAGAYEAYLMCLDKEQLATLPQVLLMYFRYQSNLSYDKKAIVYSNVILHKNEYKSLYQQYQRTIESFAIEQIREGRIDDSLSIIYQDVLDGGMINEEIAGSAAPLLHTARLAILRDDIIRVIVIFKQLARPVIVPVKDSICYIPMYTDKYAIFLEDRKGVLHARRGDYSIEPLLKTDGLDGSLMSLSPYSIPYVIRFFDKLRDDSALRVEDLHCVSTLISSPAISEEYKISLYPLIIGFLREHAREDMIADHLAKEAPYNRVDSKVLAYIIELFIASGDYERAYYLYSTYNGTYVDKKSIIDICEHMIAEGDEETKKGFFLSTLVDAMDEGRLSEQALILMCDSYVGPTDRMLALWEQASACIAGDYDSIGDGSDSRISSESTYIDVAHDISDTDLDNDKDDAFKLADIIHKLEDRILVQMFYSEDIDVRCHDVLKSYTKGEYNKMLVEAVLTYYSHEYVLGHIDTLDEFDAGFIYKKYNRADKVNDSCKIALMKYLCLQAKAQDEETDIVDNLVREYVVKNVYFPFYKSMSHRLIVKYHLYDKKFVEYIGKPNSRINIVYKKNDGEVVAGEMPEMYPGIYVRQFVIFFGDNIYYEVHEGESEEVLARDVITCNDIVSEHDGRFDRINEMQSSLIYYDEKKLLDEMKDYYNLDYVTKQLFARV